MYRSITALFGLGAVALAASATLDAGDPSVGKQVYARCAGCHSPERDRTGPRHCGLIGRVAGSVPGFEYSAAMRESKIIWTAEMLGQFLEAPMTFLPGTNMAIAGIKDPGKRRDLIAYLEDMSSSRDVCNLELSSSLGGLQ